MPVPVGLPGQSAARPWPHPDRLTREIRRVRHADQRSRGQLDGRSFTKGRTVIAFRPARANSALVGPCSSRIDPLRPA